MATRQARVAANCLCGVPDRFPGVLGTSICKVFDLTVARTGLTEQRARDLGHPVTAALVPTLDRAHFMPNAAMITLKLIADGQTRRLIGMQGVGPGDVAKRTDLAAAAISSGMSVDDAANLDLAYGPSYSTALDSFHTACNVLRNKLDGRMVGLAPHELRVWVERHEPAVYLDVRTHTEFDYSRFDGALHIPLPALKSRLEELPHDRPVVVYSTTSLTAYEAAVILKAGGWPDVRVLDGGLTMLG